MAFTYSPQIFTGAHYGQIFSELLHSNDTIAKNLCTLITDVKNSIQLTEKEGKLLIQDYKVVPGESDANGTFKMSDVTLTPEKKMLYDRFTYEDLRSSRFSADMSSGAASMVSDEWTQAALAHIQENASADMERTFWTLIQQGVSASTTAQKVSGVTLTEANIAEQMGLVYKKIPAAIKRNKDLRIFVDYSVYDFVMLLNNDPMALREQFQVIDENTHKFLGIKLEYVPMGENKMIAGIKSDIVWGTDLVNDVDNIEIGKVYNDGDLYFMKGVFTIAAAVKVQKQKVLYGI